MGGDFKEHQVLRLEMWTEQSNDVAFKKRLGVGGGFTDSVDSWHIWNNTDGGSHTGHFMCVFTCRREGSECADIAYLEGSEAFVSVRALPG